MTNDALIDGDQADEFARIGTEKVLPQVKRLDPFEGSLVLANRRRVGAVRGRLLGVLASAALGRA
jgi:hypothetical protein